MLEIVPTGCRQGCISRTIPVGFSKSQSPAISPLVRPSITSAVMINRARANAHLHTRLSHSADIIIYDAVNCPVLYQGQTSIVPVECVYGIVEVKSKLSKSELIDAMGKIEPFKRLAPLDPSVVRTREYVTVERRSRPCGIAFGFALDRNSLGSLAENYTAAHARIHDVNYYTNLGLFLEKV
jgi:hypothetical protein